MLDRIGEGLADQVIRRQGQLFGRSPVTADRHRDRHRLPFGELADGVRQAAIGEDLRVDAADGLAQRRHRRLHRRPGGGQRLADGLGASGVEGVLGLAELHAEQHQLLLRAVVQVALDPAAFGREHVHQLAAGGGQLIDLLAQFRAGPDQVLDQDRLHRGQRPGDVQPGDQDDQQAEADQVDVDADQHALDQLGGQAEHQRDQEGTGQEVDQREQHRNAPDGEVPLAQPVGVPWMPDRPAGQRSLAAQAEQPQPARLHVGGDPGHQRQHEDAQDAGDQRQDSAHDGARAVGDRAPAERADQHPQRVRRRLQPGADRHLVRRRGVAHGAHPRRRRRPRR